MVNSPIQILHLWHDIHLHLVHHNKIDLSTRQLTILLTIYTENPPHTIRGLAKKLNVTKPVITRAINHLSQNKLVVRKTDQSDRRNILIMRTVDGSLFVENLSDIINQYMEKYTDNPNL